MTEEDELSQVSAALGTLLTQGETVLAAASQNVVNSPLKRDTAVVTNRRFLIYRPRILGRMDLDDYLWQDVDDVAVSTQLLGSTITVRGSKRLKTGEQAPFSRSVGGLDKAKALTLYAKAQEMEEVWREKNRVRYIDEERAKSGGVTIQGGAGVAAAPGGPSIEQRLAKLRDLLEQELITTAEYEARKAQIIAEL